jgi:hypothetical protein
MARTVWAGRILAGLMFLFLAMDAIVHVLKIKPVVDAFEKLSLPLSLSVPLGILVLVLLGLFLYPPTRIVALVLITGYLGGAVATHLRAGSTPFECVFPVLIGGLLWLGVYLIDPRVSQILP